MQEAGHRDCRKLQFLSKLPLDCHVAALLAMTNLMICAAAPTLSLRGPSGPWQSRGSADQEHGCLFCCAAPIRQSKAATFPTGEGNAKCQQRSQSFLFRSSLSELYSFSLLRYSASWLWCFFSKAIDKKSRNAAKFMLYLYSVRVGFLTILHIFLQCLPLKDPCNRI